MTNCFNHKDKQPNDTCLYCGKQYCSDCLLLHGERKSIICNNCYSVFESKFKKSRIRRFILIIFCFLVSGFYTVDLLETLNSAGILDAYFNIPIILIMLSLGIFNLLRIRQMKNWLKTYEYKYE